MSAQLCWRPQSTQSTVESTHMAGRLIKPCSADNQDWPTATSMIQWFFQVLRKWPTWTPATALPTRLSLWGAKLWRHFMSWIAVNIYDELFFAKLELRRLLTCSLDSLVPIGVGHAVVQRSVEAGRLEGSFHGTLVMSENRRGWEQVDLQPWWQQNNFAVLLVLSNGHHQKRTSLPWKMHLLDSMLFWMTVDLHQKIYQWKMMTFRRIGMKRSDLIFHHYLQAWWFPSHHRNFWLEHLQHHLCNLNYPINILLDNSNLLLYHSYTTFNSNSKQSMYTLTAQHTSQTHNTSSSSFTDTEWYLRHRDDIDLEPQRLKELGHTPLNNRDMLNYQQAWHNSRQHQGWNSMSNTLHRQTSSQYHKFHSMKQHKAADRQSIHRRLDNLNNQMSLKWKDNNLQSLRLTPMMHQDLHNRLTLLYNRRILRNLLHSHHKWRKMILIFLNYHKSDPLRQWSLWLWKKMEPWLCQEHTGMDHHLWDMDLDQEAATMHISRAPNAKRMSSTLARTPKIATLLKVQTLQNQRLRRIRSRRKVMAAHTNKALVEPNSRL